MANSVFVWLGPTPTFPSPLEPSSGGTGISSYAIGDLLYASASTTLSKLADVAVGSVLVSGGVGVAPAWSATPSSLTSVGFSGGSVLIGSASNVVEQRNSTTAQQYQIYSTFTNASNYERIAIVPGTTNDIRSETQGGSYRGIQLTGVSITLATGASGGAATGRWQVNTAGTLLTLASDNSLDIGASGATRPRTLYLGTSVITPLTTTTGFSLGARSTSSNMQSATEAVTLSGATSATTNIVPAGATVQAVATTTTTTITGASGYQVGDGSDADRWGDITGTAVGTASGSTNFTADPRWWTNAARAITLTAKTSNFTGGVVQVTVFYITAAGA